MHKKNVLAALIAAVLVVGPAAGADVTAPPKSGTVGWWVHPCELFVEMMAFDRMLSEPELVQAALCQGLFTGVIAVNYADPPYLPFCVGDRDTALDYARTFLAFVRTNPGYSDKELGLGVLVALGKAHPKEQCAHASG